MSMKTTRHPLLSVCAALLLAVACQAPEQANTTSNASTLFQQSASQQSPVTRLLSEDGQQVSLTIDVPSFRAGTGYTHDRMFSTLECPDCGVTSELGKPRLPAIRRFVEIPAGMTATVELEPLKTEAVALSDIGAGSMLFPVQRPVEKVPGAMLDVPFEMDQELYTTDAYYPAQSVSLSGPFVIRGHHLVLVEFYPVRYNPVQAEIEIVPSGLVRVLLNGTPVALDRSSASRPSMTIDGWLARNVVNARPDTARAGARFADGMLFVVGDAYLGNQELAAYLDARRDEGYQVVQVAMSDIGASADELRAYIQAQYASWTDPALTYVVLVGDVQDVPTHTGSGGGKSQATDLYFASIDPDDYVADLLAPDLIVSRISVNDEAELDNYLQRARHYLFADYAVDTAWMEKFSFIASCDNSNISEGTHNYAITNYTAPLGLYGTYPENPQAGGDQLYCSAGGLDQSVIQAALGDGRVVINFSGHGSQTSWADPSFTDTYLNEVLPPDAAPFVISNACLTGSFAKSGGDCWGEMWLNHSHGAILFWGASNSSYWDEDDIMEKRMWDGVFADGITRLAGIVSNAKLALLSHYGANQTMEYYFEMYNMLGDATLDLFTGFAREITAEYAGEMPLGSGQVDLTVSIGGQALEGALVSVRGLGAQQVGVTDSAGQVHLTLDPPPAEVGNLKVTISAHNARRHEGVIQVIPSDGPYLVHRDHLLTSDGETPIAATPGAQVVMPITVENIGTATAADISATLASSSPLVTIDQAQAVFPEIPAGTLAGSIAHARFTILPDAADGSLISFRLDWQVGELASGTTRFSVTVKRPVLVYAGHGLSDADGGCDLDGIADVGEPTRFDVNIVNTGSGDASGVVVALAAPDCDVSGPVALGGLAAGAQALVSFVVTPGAGIACPAQDIPFTVSAAADQLPQADLSGFSELLNADLQGDVFAEDMEAGEPAGWSHAASAGTDDWAPVDTSFHSGSTAWFASDAPQIKDDVLLTPAIVIGDTAVLTFWQRVDLETGYDGAVLEISTDGGETFTDLAKAITENGYGSTISTGYSNPLSGRSAWSGKRDWQQVTVDLSSFGPAEVILRFRLGCDSSVGEQGWWIDDVRLDYVSILCQQSVCGE